ncbi:MAG TPA: hypothetical protein VF174_04340 [Micromonosporaceae bacterium]
MSALPRPIPHPLDTLPWDVPGWVYESLEWVVGAEWPEGDEQEVWDLADRWFEIAAVLAGPTADAAEAADEVRGAYGDTGPVAAAFVAAWRKVAEGEQAPLTVPVVASAELGRLVEECGCDIEAAKIEIWIQVGLLVIELLALGVAAVLTAGAASPAMAAAITATRLVIRQTIQRLLLQLSAKTLRNGVQEATERAVRELSTGAAHRLIRSAGVEGLREAGEEVAIGLGTQIYQNSAGRREGIDIDSLGRSALGGLAGGAAASLAGLGGHATGRAGRAVEEVARSAGAEVLAETAASLVTGNGVPDLTGLARSATSGAGGSVIGQAGAAVDARLDALTGVPGQIPLGVLVSGSGAGSAVDAGVVSGRAGRAEDPGDSSAALGHVATAASTSGRAGVAAASTGPAVAAAPASADPIVVAGPASDGGTAAEVAPTGSAGSTGVLAADAGTTAVAPVARTEGVSAGTLPAPSVGEHPAGSGPGRPPAGPWAGPTAPTVSGFDPGIAPPATLASGPAAALGAVSAGTSPSDVERSSSGTPYRGRVEQGDRRPGGRGTPEPAVMLRDPTPQQLRELGTGRATFADLGLDPADLDATERDRLELALRHTALLAPHEIRFTQRSVSPATRDKVTVHDLAEGMRRSGWRGGPIHAVCWGDGTLSSLDNRRLRAARDAGLDAIPVVVHRPSESLADWPHEWSPQRQRRCALSVEIRELPDGTWVVGGDEGRVVYEKGSVPRTFGEIALFRAAEQRSLLPGHLFGADREPVLLGRPPDRRRIKLTEEEQRVLDDLRLRATEAADRVEGDLVAVGQAVSAAFGQPVRLRGQEHRVKTAESLARKYHDEARVNDVPVTVFAGQVRDVLRFSLVMPGGARFKPAVERVVAELVERGYRIEDFANMWRPGNRRYGFTCTVTSPDGQVFELRLPTEQSWRADRLTDELDRVIRRPDELPARRVHAFLQVLAVNKRLAMADFIPADVGASVPARDTGFVRWIRDNYDVWREYRAWLDLNGRSFAEIVAEFGLDAGDFPGLETVADTLGEVDAELFLALPHA